MARPSRAPAFLFIVLTALFPSSASALTLTQMVGLFHVVVGILLTFTLLIFATGIGMYIARLNTWPSHRETAIRVLEWAVAMLFVLIVLITIVSLIQRHGAFALVVLAFIVIVGLALLVLRTATQGRKKKAPPSRQDGAPPARPRR